MTTDLRDRILPIIASHMGIQRSEIKGDARLVADLGCDSLDTIELVMAIEDEFAIEIPYDDAEQIVTVDQAVAYVEKRMENKA